jgi:site-specific DNA-cytosine methylase
VPDADDDDVEADDEAPVALETQTPKPKKAAAAKGAAAKKAPKAAAAKKGKGPTAVEDGDQEATFANVDAGLWAEEESVLPSPMPTRLAVLELFAGCGGLHLEGGVSFGADGDQLSMHTLAAVEIEEDPAQTYKLNHPSVNVMQMGVGRFLGTARRLDNLKKGVLPAPSGEIREKIRVTSRDIMVLMAHKENRLLGRFMEVVWFYRPMYVVMEEVPDVAKKPEVMTWMHMVLQNKGYNVTYEKRLRTGMYGCPQTRDRLIVLGAMCGLPHPAMPLSLTAPHARESDNVQQAFDSSQAAYPSPCAATPTAPSRRLRLRAARCTRRRWSSWMRRLARHTSRPAPSWRVSSSCASCRSTSRRRRPRSRPCRARRRALRRRLRRSPMPSSGCATPRPQPPRLLRRRPPRSAQPPRRFAWRA